MPSGLMEDSHQATIWLLSCEIAISGDHISRDGHLALIDGGLLPASAQRTRTYMRCLGAYTCTHAMSARIARARALTTWVVTPGMVVGLARLRHTLLHSAGLDVGAGGNARSVGGKVSGSSA